MFRPLNYLPPLPDRASDAFLIASLAAAISRNVRTFITHQLNMTQKTIASDNAREPIRLPFHLGVFSKIALAVRGWHGRAQQRARDRSGLLQLTDRDFRDMGLTRNDIIYEIEKPFWRI